MGSTLFRVWGSGVQAYGSEFRVSVSESKLPDSGFMAPGSGLLVYGF